MGRYDEATKTFKEARAALESCPSDASEDEFEKLNNAVIEAEKQLPWHRRR